VTIYIYIYIYKTQIAAIRSIKVKLKPCILYVCTCTHQVGAQHAMTLKIPPDTSRGQRETSMFMRSSNMHACTDTLYTPSFARAVRANLEATFVEIQFGFRSPVRKNQASEIIVSLTSKQIELHESLGIESG